MPESSENEALPLVLSTAEVVEVKRKQKTMNLLMEDMIETCSKKSGRTISQEANRQDPSFMLEKNTFYKSALVNSVLCQCTAG